MDEGEVAAGGDLVAFQVDPVDREEVGVDVVEVVKDGEEFFDAVADGVGAVGLSDLVEQSQPGAAAVYLAFPSFCFRPRARSRTLLMIHSIWSSVRALDCSSAL